MFLCVIFEVPYEFELAEDITIPDNCVLDFNGGSISGEQTLSGVNTGIRADLTKIFGTDITLAGTWNTKGFYPEWFGAKGDGVTDDGAILNAVLSMPYPMILGLKKTYITSQSLLVYRDVYGNNSTIEIADSSVNMNVIHTQNEGLSNPVCIRDLRVFGKDNARVATGFYIDTHHVTLENCIAHSFNIGILVTKWSITLFNCHSNYNNKNLCMYSYGQGGNKALINDINVIGGNYSAPAGPYCVTVGDTSFNDSIVDDYQGYRILLQGFCFDGGSIHINRIHTVTLDNLYGENPGNDKCNIYINDQQLDEETSRVADNAVCNVTIRNCYIRGGYHGIKIGAGVPTITVTDNNFTRMARCLIYSNAVCGISFLRNYIQISSGYPNVHSPLHLNRDRYNGEVDEGVDAVVRYSTSRGLSGRYICGQMFADEGGTVTVMSGLGPIGYHYPKADERASVSTTSRESNNIFGLSASDIQKFNAGDVVKTDGDNSAHVIYTCDYDNNTIRVYPSVGGSGNVTIYHAEPNMVTLQ